MVTERKIIADVVNRYLLKEYVMKATERAGFGGIDIQRNPMGTLVTLIAERPGMVIGHRGKTIKELTSVMENTFNFDNPQIEVEEEKRPNLNANIMAHKLAVALERGWHFRRAGHSTVRKIMGSGARGCQVILAGKITGERHRTEKFKEGHIKYCGEPALLTMEIGYAVAKKKLGTIGIKCMIMRPDAVLPDEITILTQEQAKGIVPEAIVEELKIDTTIKEELEEEVDVDDDAAELVESLIKEGEISTTPVTKVETPDEESTEEVKEKKPAKKAAPKKPAAKKTKAKAEPELAEAVETEGETTQEPKTDVPVETADGPAGTKDEKVKEKPKAKKAAPKKAPAKKPAKKAAATKKTTTTKKVKKTKKKADKDTEDVEEKAEETAEKKTTAKKATTKKATAAKKTTAKKAAPKKPAAKKAATSKAKKSEEKKDTESGEKPKETKDGNEPEGEGKDK